MTNPTPNTQKIFAYFILSLACIFWAGNFVLGRGVSDIVPPIALSFWRWLLATLFIAPFAWRHIQHDWPVIKAHIGYFFLMGLLGGATFNALTYMALHTTTANNALTLNAANALLIVLANYLIHQLKPTKAQLLAILIAIVGMGFIITEGKFNKLSQFSFKSGDILILGAMIGWALYTALLINKPKTHPLSFATLIFFTATLILLPFAILEHHLGFKASPTIDTISTILYAAIFPGLLAYVFYNKGVEIIGGNRAGIMIYLVPVFGAILSFIFLGETLKPYHLIGISLIISGVILSSIKSPRK